MTLIELAIGLTILSILITLAAPSFGVWSQNGQIRSAAESIQNGLQQARMEAVRRNTTVRFQLTSSLDNSCTLSTSGRYWVINLTSDATPDSSCASANDDSTAPYLIQSSPAGNAASTLTVAATQSTIAFNGLGRLTSTTNPTTSVGTTTIDVSSTSALCLTATGGTLRCLRIEVSPAGLIRMCDPAIPSGSTMSDAMGCTT